VGRALDRRVVVITGAGRGIGASLARAMAAEGASVVVNDLGVALDGSGFDRSPADEVVAEIQAQGGQAVSNHDDVADFAAAGGIIRQALETYGQLDALFNVAGILRDRMIYNLSEADWDAVIRVHLKGTFNTSHHASKHWHDQNDPKGQNRIVNFTSGAAMFGSPGQPNYAAAKLGIVGLTYSLANSLGRYGVTANAISPGASTRMTASVPEGRRNSARTEDDPKRSPDNVAAAAMYLASTRSGWCSGRVIRSSGPEMGIYNLPEVIETISSDAPWTFDTAAAAIETWFKPVVDSTPARRRPQPSRNAGVR
jgi:NAD(P)-dependent dehydrogenase (short-subunit alcohol dehydrogenase family)